MQNIQSMIKELAAKNGPPRAPSNSGGVSSYNSTNIQLSDKQSAWMVSCGASFKDVHVGAIISRKDFDAWVQYKKNFIAATGSPDEGPISGTYAYSCFISMFGVYNSKGIVR